MDNKCFNCEWLFVTGNNYEFRWKNRVDGGDPKKNCVLFMPNCPHGADYGHGPIPPEPKAAIVNDGKSIKVQRCDQWQRRYVDYKDYLESELWAVIKRVVFKIRGYRCEICGTAKNLTVHHLTYDRIGAEELEDLLVVCKSCHRKIHETDIERDGTNGR